jgi:hypothetical protein
MTSTRLSPLHDLGQVLLHHQRLRAAGVERLDDAAQVQAVGPDAEDAHAAHAVQRLEDDVVVLGVEGAHVVGVARHQRGPDELRELQDRQLLGVVAQRRGLVEHTRAFTLGLAQQVGGVEVLGVERRVLAHHDGAGVLQRQRGVFGLHLEPVVASPVSVISRTVAVTGSPRRQRRPCGSQASSRGRGGPPRASSRRSNPCGS